MRRTLTALAFLGAFAASVATAQDNKVIVELYTSQGCSSCPPADAFLQDLAGRTDVIALALHVDYWDYLGWKDGFGSPAYTARQHGYARAARAETVYTPQMVIGGVDHVIGSKAMEVMDRIAAQRTTSAPVAINLARDGHTLQIQAVSNAGRIGDMIVQVVRYTPQKTVEITRGENAGKSINYVNIVTSWQAIGRWDGAGPFAMSTQIDGHDPVVVIVQHDEYGPVVAAAELR